MATGVFFYYQQGERLRDFPQVLGGLLDAPQVFFYDAFYEAKPPSDFDLDPIPLESLYRVHDPQMVARVRALPAYQGALYSASGTVAAAVRIARRELKNAFVFTGYGDHHAGRNFYGGGCYFNGAALAVHELRARFGLRRFAIIDTDAHHGDGTWQLFARDSEVLYICFCPQKSARINFNLNIPTPPGMGNARYLALAERAFAEHVPAFAPELIFWNWGYDGTQGEYGDLGLSPGFHAQMAALIKGLAGKVCGGKLIVILCGGSKRPLARTLIPPIIDMLAAE